MAPNQLSPFQSELEARLRPSLRLLGFRTIHRPDSSGSGTKQTNRQRDVRSAIDPNGQFVTYAHE